MRRRRLLPGSFLLFLLLGAALGLAECGSLVRLPIARFNEFKRIRPVSLDWIHGIEPFGHSLQDLDGALRGVSVALLLLALAAFTALLDPDFGLLQPPEENPGQGAGAHLDLRRLWKTILWMVVTLWWLGVLAPLALVAPVGTRLNDAILTLLGGFPIWLGGLPWLLYAIGLSVALGAVIWAIWGRGGLASHGASGNRWALLGQGLVAGAAASPAFLLLQQLPVWIGGASQAYSLSQPADWYPLLWAAALGPFIACVLLGVVVALFSSEGRPWRLVGAVAAVLGVATTLVMETRLDRMTRELDLGPYGLRRRLGFYPIGLTRFALLLAPDGRALLSTTPDGSTDPDGRDPIECKGETVGPTEAFLARRKWRTRLAFRAWTHLHACASIDWLRSRNLALTLELLEHAPSPIAGPRLLEMLEDSPPTAENLRVLDKVADPKRFTWLDRDSRRWLGETYLRFGEVQKAREYLLKADLSPEEQRTLLGGVTPLADGVIRGSLTVNGRPEAGVRVGLVREDRASELPGMQSPSEWRRVTVAVHTDAEGRFAFRDIAEGRYVMILTGGGIGRRLGQPAVSGHPGVIELDRFRAEINLKPMDLYWLPVEEEPPVPEGITT